MGQQPPMPPKRSESQKVPPRRSAGPSKGHRIVRKLAQSTLLAAGLAVTQLGSLPEVDPRFKLFDRTLLDRLRAPIPRVHE